jgi:hypothetical protein
VKLLAMGGRDLNPKVRFLGFLGLGFFVRVAGIL